MARTANVFARVEPEVKEQAEQVLDRLGIPMSNAVGMFLRQIVLQRGIPSHKLNLIKAALIPVRPSKIRLVDTICACDIETISYFPALCG